MRHGKSRFALFFGTRGFFPSMLLKEARSTLPRLLHEWGHETLMLPEDATPHGGVETPREGRIFADFLAAHRGRFDGVILCLANFGDETGAVAALKDAGVPIFIQAYPDRIGEMGPASRRDAFCGKLALMDVFRQHEIPFTALTPHVVAPTSTGFKNNVDHFDKVCRIVRGMRGLVVGMIGARTSPFKSVRCDELTLQKNGITVETFDLSSLLARARDIQTSGDAYQAKAASLRDQARWNGVPEAAFENIARLGVALDAMVEENELDAIAVRCWLELEEQLGVTPCAAMGNLSERCLPAACETDLASAVTMYALGLASGAPAACLDWNNNYGDEEDKCILFHCAALPPSLMDGKGRITDHAILATALGPGRSYGPNQGRIRSMDFTFGNLVTQDGRLKFYLGEGTVTDDPIEDAFFGCAGVARIERLEDVLLHMAQNGHRHHVAITPGRHLASVREALEHYLGFDVALPQMEICHAV